MNIEEIRDNTAGSLRRKITDYFREEILSGRLAPGAQLPSTHLLAAELETGVASVQRALAVLQREGLITRLPRLGSIVTEQKKELRTVAVYSFFNPQYPPGPFLRLLLGYLQIELKSRGLDCRIYHDNQRPFTLKNVRRHYERREFDAVVFLDIKEELHTLIPAFPAPNATFATLDAEVSRCCFPHTDLAEKVVEAFRRTGKKKISVISSIPVSSPSAPVRSSFYRALDDAVAREGLELLPEHRSFATGKFPGADVENFALFAYREFKRLWALPNRPEALFLYSDDCFPGLLAALFELGVRIPEDLELLVHHNREHRMICPVECTYIENSIREYAAGILDVLMARYRGGIHDRISHFEIVCHHPTDDEKEML